MREDAANTRPPEQPDPGWPSVSVIVPVYGDRGELALTARALAEQSYPGSVEIIVADNGDNVGLEESLQGLGATVVEEAQPGSYAARNAALRVATGEVLAFTDGDCLPRPDWLQQGVAALLDAPDPSFVGGAIRLFARRPDRPNAAELWDSVNGLRQDHYVGEQGWAATANMITRRATLDRVGTFDARLKSGGDREWGQRAAAAGVRPIYCDEAVVDHPARDTMAALQAKIRRVTHGDVDLRRASGSPLFEVRTLFSELRPNTRSIARRSKAVSSSWTRERLRYVAVAHWVQYYFIWSRLSYALRRRTSQR